jgi:hypothetical protein
MDAVECLRLRDGSGACWLRLTDEYTGAILATEAFAQYRWAGVPATSTQQALRQAFARWGCPPAFRVDNGNPWGSPSGFPSGVALWLAGLGVAVHHNDPYRPEQSGAVESRQGVSQRWVNAQACAGVAELRRRVAREGRVQREEYPAVQGKSRREAYPALCHTGRGYTRGWEDLVWDLRGALGLPARYRLRRKVSARGQVSAYHRLIQVGEPYGGSWVYLGMDAPSGEWLVTDAHGGEIRRRPAPEFTQQSVMNLEVTGS